MSLRWSQLLASDGETDEQQCERSSWASGGLRRSNRLPFKGSGLYTLEWTLGETAEQEGGAEESRGARHWTLGPRLWALDAEPPPNVLQVLWDLYQAHPPPEWGPEPASDPGDRMLNNER